MKSMRSRRVTAPARSSRAPKGAPRKRILIVEDHPLMREGLANAINRERDLTVCGEARAASEAMEAVRKLRPDLALIDITLPDKSGLELIKDLKAMHPDLLMLAVSMHDESLYAERVLRAGGSGYITKQRPPEELIGAIRQVFDDHIYVSSEMSERIVKRFSGRRPATPSSPVEMLSDREFEILQLIGEGKARREIALQLHISPKTVAVHHAHIREKLNVRTGAGLIRFAVQWQDLKNLVHD